MHIALLSWESLHSIPVGGLAAHVTELAESLTRLGHDVHLFTRMGRDQRAYDLIQGVHYHRVRTDSHHDFVTYVDGMCRGLVERLKEAEAFYGRRFDVVHGHDWLAAKALARAKNELGHHVICTIHSTEFGRCGNELRNGESRRIRDVEWEGTYVADRVICVSQALRDEVHQLYGVPVEKITAIYNGVHVQRFDVEVDAMGIRGRFGIGPDEPLVLFVGRVTWQKGPDLLLEAIPEVRSFCPGAKFVFVGDGDMRAWMEGRAAALGLFDCVRFAGHQSGLDLVSLFRAADVLCVPSRNEPFGIVILEGWSAVKAVVASRNGGPSEFVRDNETGLLVFANKDSIAWGLGMALADGENARRLGRNGRSEVETRFSWDIIAAQTQAVYQAN